VDASPEWAFGNPQLARLLGIETPQPRFLGDVIADGGAIAVLDGERNDRVSLALERSIRRQLEDVDREVLLFATQRDRAPQHLFRSDRSIKIHSVSAALKCQRPQ
jgi:hypothetical protein